MHVQAQEGWLVVVVEGPGYSDAMTRRWRCGEALQEGPDKLLYQAASNSRPSESSMRHHREEKVECQGQFVDVKIESQSMGARGDGRKASTTRISTDAVFQGRGNGAVVEASKLGDTRPREECRDLAGADDGRCQSCVYGGRTEAA